MMMKKLLTFLMICLAAGAHAQNTLRIHYHNGSHSDIAINRIDSLTFVETQDQLPDEEATLTGSWLWGRQEAGYYELLTFNEDHTYTGYDNYFEYGFDNQTYGWYTHVGAMLTLQSNGYGYQRRYNWYVTALTGNALEVMTRTGPFTYYRLQPEIIRIATDGYLTCADGEAFVFADGVVVSVVDGTLKGMMPGTTYILKRVMPANTIQAYKVIVE